MKVARSGSESDHETKAESEFETELDLRQGQAETRGQQSSGSRVGS